PPFDDPKPEPPTIEDATALRRALVAAGYVPLPLYGKTPPVYGKNNQRKGFGDWQNLTVLTDEMVAMWKKTWPDALKTVVTDEMIAMWAKTWPDAVNTGVLTYAMPTLDLDILNEDAARACEDLIRERYEDAGYVLTRIGKPPKRAIPFRTDEAFEKITANLIAPSGATGE